MVTTSLSSSDFSASGGMLLTNYTLPTAASGVATITKANATVIANSGIKTYNAQPQFISGFSASGLVGGETASVLIGVSTFGGSGTNPGTYELIASGTDVNYNLVFINGALTINKVANLYSPFVLPSVSNIIAPMPIQTATSNAATNSQAPLVQGALIVNGNSAVSQTANMAVNASSSDFVQVASSNPVASSAANNALGSQMLNVSSGAVTKPNIESTTNAKPDGNVLSVQPASTTTISQQVQSLGYQSKATFDGISIGSTQTGSEVKAIIIQGALSSPAPVTMLVNIKSGEGFSFSMPKSAVEQVVSSVSSNVSTAQNSISAVLSDGKALPAWLSFDRNDIKFSSSNVPQGGLPLAVKVVITSGNSIKSIEVVLGSSGASM